jgi:integrase
MARTKRSAKLDTRNARLRLPTEQRHQEPLSSGKYLAYRRPKSGAAGSWLARWYDAESRKDGQERLGIADDFQDADGASILSYGQAQAKAQEFFKAREHQAIHGIGSLPQDGPLTVAQAVDRYLAQKETEGGKSIRDMRHRVELWIKPHLGGTAVAKLTREKVKAWHQAIADSEKRHRPKEKPEPERVSTRKTRKDKKENPKREAIQKKDVSEEEAKRKRKATANRVLASLKAALSCAREHGWVICSGDAWELVKPFRGVDEPRQEYLTPQQQQRLLNAIEDPDFRKLVAGALVTGCRYGELCRLRVNDFDPTHNGSILIRVSKSGKSRRVMLAPDGKAFFQSITAGRGPDELVFTHEAFRGRDWNGEKVRREWKQSEQQRPMMEACKAAGLPVMGFHQLRHSYASALVSAGMPLAMVATLTGHADTRMLERHYAHLAPSDVARVLAAMAPSLDLGGGNVEELAIKRSS